MDSLTKYKGAWSKEAINALPIIRYEGPVHLVERLDELDAALDLLSADTVLGFDTEMRPCFERGKQTYPASLLQLAGANAVVLVRLKEVPLHGRLADLLADENCLKVGVAIADDMRLLQRRFSFTPAGLIDLGLTARHMGLKTQGLRSLAANFLGGRLSKGAQCSNWEKSELSVPQIFYAATDAWIGRELYLKMQQIPEMIFHSVDLTQRKTSLKRRRFSRRTSSNHP